MKSKQLVLLLCGLAPLVVWSAVAPEDLPADTIWYLHADLEQMRSTESGAPIYNWFDDEVVDEVGDELGINISDEVDAITAFSDEQLGTVIVVDGPLTSNLQQKMLAAVQLDTELVEHEHDGMEYFFAGDEASSDNRGSDPFDDLEDGVFFSFGVRNKLIVASREEQMKAMLESGGRIAGSGSVEGAMFVLSADKSFVQAGLRPEGMADDGDDDWESNIIRNTEQAALLISDSNGMIALQAQLTSTEPKMAESIGGIVNGLISLQAFNSELDPQLQSLVQNTKVTVSGKQLSISTVIDPHMVVDIVDD